MAWFNPVTISLYVEHELASEQHMSRTLEAGLMVVNQKHMTAGGMAGHKGAKPVAFQDRKPGFLFCILFVMYG